eukprot:GEMP01024205.1.p1 GENE.GEMP01024205.1~~GEMP01024205.1.p1  ORF type:complete len:608 (+),score=180.38 GEMP01024205.1:130-1953(+)
MACPLLAICDSEDFPRGESEVFSGTAQIRQRRLEPAGRNFFEAFERATLKEKKPDGRKKDDKDDKNDEEKWQRKRRKKNDKRSGNALYLSANIKDCDLYAVIGIGEGASQDEIKKAYRKMALVHHPDKVNEEKDDDVAQGLSEQEIKFVKIQEAYDILSDESKRQKYDSTRDFDDEIPTDFDPGKNDFYEVFRPVFERNARWSVRKPMKALGDQNTPIEEVSRFYDAWRKFESWRDFSQNDEYDLNDADFREERRWMERQNLKIRKKFQNEENARLIELVSLSEKFDPRLIEERERQRVKKELEKEDRRKAKEDNERLKREKEEEKLRIEQEKKEQEDAHLATQKEEKKQLNERKKKMRQKIKRLGKASIDFDEIAFSDLLLSLEEKQLESLAASLEKAGTEGGAIDVVLRAVKTERDTEQEEAKKLARQEDQKKAAKQDVERQMAKIWSNEELSLLAKGLAKFPGGHGTRWDCISKMLAHGGFERSPEQVVEKAREMSKSTSLKSLGATVSKDAFGNFLQTNKKITLSAKTEVPAEKTGAVGAEQDVQEDVWTAEQQQALEKALVEFPAALPANERWRKIGEAVSGKTKKQCVARFKFLRDQLKKG